MTKRISKTTCLVFILSVAVFMAVATTTAAPPAQGATRLLMGSTKITSGYYVVAVALASAINKSGQGFNVTTVETGAGYDNLLRLKRGDLQFATIQTASTVWEANNGEGKYAGKPDPIYRLLFPLYVFTYLTAVTQESGVKTMSDLNGKGFFYGIVGSTAERYSNRMFQALGVKPKKYVGGLSDATGAMKDRRIVGMYKASATTVLDSALKDINVLQPIRLITLTPDEVKKVDAAIPGAAFITVKAGSYSELKEQGKLVGLGGSTCTITTNKMDEATGYKLTKAMAENWKTVVPSNNAIIRDPMKDFLGLMRLGGKIVAPLHAGTVRYLKEKGITVLDEFLPPEYKK